MVGCGRRSERRRGFCDVLDDDRDGKIIHPYKQAIDNFVEKLSPKYLNVYWMYKLWKYKKEWIGWLVASKEPDSIFFL